LLKKSKQTRSVSPPQAALLLPCISVASPFYHRCTIDLRSLRHNFNHYNSSDTIMSHTKGRSHHADEEESVPPPPAQPEDESEDDSDDDFGPAPLPASNDSSAANDVSSARSKKKKKRRKLEHEEAFLAALPNADMYEKSYMHRDTVTQCAFTPRTDFLITASEDGHVKFWKKMPEGLEFVKHYHAHLGPIRGLAVSGDGLRLATTGADKAIKFYDVLTFDLTYMLDVDFSPSHAVWVHRPGEAHGRLAVADADTPCLRIYRSDGSQAPIHTLPTMHAAPVTALAFSPSDALAISADVKGMLEYWSTELEGGDGDAYTFPRKKVFFRSKLDSDLFEMLKRKTYITAMDVSRDGSKLATVGKDRHIRVFDLRRGKLLRVYNEGLEVAEAAMATGTLGLDTIDFGRRSAVEHELEGSAPDVMARNNAVFDETGHFLIYATLLGIKTVNVETNRVVKVLGKIESGERFLRVCVFQGVPKVDSQMVKALNKGKTASSVEEMRAQLRPDPTVVATAFNKRRFYLFTRRMPSDVEGEGLGEDGGRDVLNEKPTAEEATVASATDKAQQELGKAAILRTTMGDIHLKLFKEECPRTIENFVTLARNGYYDNVLFHRVIKGFMVQTGDPQGDGTGGESIWGGEFEDEIHRNLRHDRPFTLSMANAGPNTNGSQFFITTVPTPWLDGKHTVFGRVVQGMDVVSQISQVKVDPQDRPFADVKIINVDTL